MKKITLYSKKGAEMERLTESNPSWIDDELWESACEPDCEKIDAVYRKLKKYEDSEEQGKLINLPCTVGDDVYLIDRDENNKLKVYEGKWKRVSLVQTSKDGSFNLCGEISYDIYDCFYNDGRMIKHGMHVGQERTKIGEVVFLTKSEAEMKLKELKCSINGRCKGNKDIEDIER